jgi:hypothetical protein
MRGLCALQSGILSTIGVLAASSCAADRSDEAVGDSTQGILTATGGGTSGPADDPADSADTEKLDVMAHGTDGLPCGEGEQCDECVVMEHEPCDDGTTDVFEAMGLNCPGDPQVTTSASGSTAAIGIRSSFGTTGQWPPREGTVYAVLGSGLISDLDMPTPPGDLDIGPTHCNDDLGAEYDMGTTLPAPIRTNDVGGDCSMNAGLLGTGDCSNTIEGQFDQGGSANDYTELRIEATVPPSNNSLSYDFAFFSTEYPFYYGSAFNDMYIGWLESESWTGNISFDEAGKPISLNAGFLDYRDDGGALPDFQGTCMQRHAGTKWLSTVAPVTPGEQITLIFAIFDLSDSILDSYVFLDNFQWGCEGTDKPTTTPVG